MACFYSLCFSLSFFIPSSSSSHSAIKQNKLSSLRSARRLVLFTSYPSTVRHVRWDFSCRERRAIPRRGGGPADWLLSRHSHSVPDEICLLFAVTGDGIDTLLACLCCLRLEVHRIHFACKYQPGQFCQRQDRKKCMLLCLGGPSLTHYLC